MIRSLKPLMNGSFSRFLFCIAILLSSQLLFAQAKETFSAFEGYYRMEVPSGEVFHIGITPRENGLTLRQFWDGKAIRFQPTADLEFKAVDSSFPLKFKKGAGGTMSEVLAFNRDVWTRDDNYKPVAEPEVKLTAEQMKRLTGFYQYQSNGSYIEILIRDGQLVAKQMWDGEEHHLATKSETEVRSIETGTQGKFIKNEKGLITQLMVNDRDLLNRVNDYKPEAKKVVKLTEEQAKAVSGYYQKQNKKEAYVRVTANADGITLKQMWDGQEKSFSAESPLVFYGGRDRIVFSKDPDGIVNQFLAFGQDVWKRANDYKPVEKKGE